MALPTPTEFKQTFPEFDAVDDPSVQSAINLAALWVEAESWSATDFFYGAMWLAAHYLKLAQDAQLAEIQTPGTPGDSSSESTSTDLATFISSVQIADRKITWGKLGTVTKKQSGTTAVASLKGATSTDLVLGLTRYGQEFQRLQYRNADHVLVVY